jgi:hypothetical protein
MMVGFNTNLATVRDSATGKAYGQVYNRTVFFYGDDADFTEVTLDDIEAGVTYFVAERWVGDLTGAIGLGIMVEPEEGENDIHVPLMLEFGYQLFNIFTVSANGQYIPIKDDGDLVVAALTLGVKL